MSYKFATGVIQICHFVWLLWQFCMTFILSILQCTVHWFSYLCTSVHHACYGMYLLYSYCIGLHVLVLYYACACTILRVCSYIDTRVLVHCFGCCCTLLRVCAENSTRENFNLIMSGSVIVITPLIALMVDQKRNFKQVGMPVEFVREAQDDEEAIQSVLRGDIQLVYISPECILNSKKFCNVL